MFSILKNIWEMFVTVFILIGNTIKGVIQIITMLPDVLAYVTLSFSTLPAYALGMATLIFSLLVMYFVMKLVRG